MAEICLEELGFENILVARNLAEARTAFLKNSPDLLLMDIHLPGSKDGIDFVEEVRQSHRVPVIYLTSLDDQETFSRAKLTQPEAFLIKPLKINQLDELRRSIELALHRFEAGEANKGDEMKIQAALGPPLVNGSFFVRVGDHLKKVRTGEVTHITVAGEKYCDLHVGERRLPVRTSLGRLLERLPPEKFVRTHRGCIINLESVDHINEKESTIQVAGQDLPLGKNYRDELFKRISLLG